MSRPETPIDEEHEQTMSDDTNTTTAEQEVVPPLYSFAKNSDNEVHFRINTYRGRRFADVRLYVADERDALHPTKRGVTCALKDLLKFRDGVNALIEAAGRAATESAD